MSYLGNTTHQGFVNSTSFNVANAGANSTIITTNSTVGKSTTINGTATDENGNALANTQLNVTVNGVTYTVTTNTIGIWSLTYIPNVVGSLTVQVSWAGNGTHNGFVNTTNLNVSKAATNSSIIVSNGKVGQQTTISGVATDENSNLLANIQITVIVNGQSYNVTTTATGAWSLNYTPNASGSLSVVVSWAGNSTHNGFSNTTNFNVANASTNSTIVTSNSTVGKSTTINGTAIDENGNALANTQLNVTVNGQSYNVTTNAAGAWSLNYTPNASGSLSVIVSWAGNSTHNGFTNSTSFNVANAATNSTINVPNGNAGQSRNITGIASDENGNPLANIQITVVIDGTSYNVTTDSTGGWSLTYTPLVEGLFDLSVSWAGNSTHNGFTNSTVFSVPKIPANTTINAPDTKAKQSINITGTTTDEQGNPLANAELTITINGQSFTVITDSNGDWSLTYTPQHSGVFNVSISYAGNNTHLNFTKSTSFNVTTLNSNITIDVPVNATVGEEITISGTLTDELGNPIANADIQITIDGQDFTVTTNVNGFWILKYTPKNSGTITISVKYNGNEVYGESIKSIKFDAKEKIGSILDPIPDPKPIPNPNNITNKTTNKTNNNPATTAAMKNTGIPIIVIILVLLSILGIRISKKQK